MKDYIWLNPKHDRLRCYSASVKGAKSVVKIEIECDEPGSLGYLLEQLREIDRDQKAAAAPKRPTKKAQLALPAPMKLLPYHEEDL